MFSLSMEGYKKLGIVRGTGSSLKVKALTFIAPRTSRGMRQAARLGKFGGKVLVGSLSILDSSAAFSLEMMFYSSQAGYGSDCVGCLINDFIREK